MQVYVMTGHYENADYSPRDEPLLIMCLSAKGLRVVSKSEFCADFKKWFIDDQSLCIRGDITLPCQPNLVFLDI